MSIYKKLLEALTARRHHVVYSKFKKPEEQTSLFQRISKAMNFLQEKRDQTKKPP